MNNPASEFGPPFPDDETYRRAVRGVLSDQDAQELLKTLPSLEGWFAYGLDLNPITLGFIAVSSAFAEWYVRRFPEKEAIIAEIRTMPEDQALDEIRKGRWVQR